MFEKLNYTDFQNLMKNPNFKVYQVYGPKPNSKHYKDKTGTWTVMGSLKN